MCHPLDGPGGEVRPGWLSRGRTLAAKKPTCGTPAPSSRDLGLLRCRASEYGDATIGRRKEATSTMMSGLRSRTRCRWPVTFLGVLVAATILASCGGNGGNGGSGPSSSGPGGGPDNEEHHYSVSSTGEVTSGSVEEAAAGCGVTVDELEKAASSASESREHVELADQDGNVVTVSAAGVSDGYLIMCHRSPPSS